MHRPKEEPVTGDEQRKAREKVSNALLAELSSSVKDPFRCLSALLDAGIDDDEWSDYYHGILTDAVRIHIERHPTLLPALVSRLQLAMKEGSWPSRRMVLAAIAICMEVMPIAVQEASRQQTYRETLQDLLMKGTTDTESFSSRRFALTALSYLRTINEAIVSVLLTCCRGTEADQRMAITAARRFQAIQGDPLPVLAAALASESIITAYVVIQILTALGTSLVAKDNDLHAQIIRILVNELKDARSRRAMNIPEESKGYLEDAIYAALLRVAGWLE